MSFFFRCCCRPFLAGGDDGSRAFYGLLEVDQDATIDDIKRAYKRKSLELHPDKLAQRGQVLTPEDQARFQRVKEAYEVLVDPKRRDLYDEFGESGMKIIDDPQSVDPQTAFRNFMRSSTLDRCAIFMTILGVCAFILAWPILLCLQTDGKIHIPWTAIWTPLWVLDAIFLFLFWFLAAMGPQSPPEGLEEEWKDDFPLRCLNAVQFSCNVLFQIFLTLKLDKNKVINKWDWSNVFAPWLAWEGLNLFRNITLVSNGGVLPGAMAGTGTSTEERSLLKAMQVRQAVLGIQHGVLRIIFVALAIMKLDEKIHVTWWVVFVPLWVYFTTMFLGICVEWGMAKRVQTSLEELAAAGVAEGGDPEQGGLPAEEEMMRQQAEMMANRASAMWCQAMVMLVIALLAVARIEGAHYSVFIIFVPVFVVVGCFTCSLGCAVCCLRDPEMMMGEEMPLNPAAQAGNMAGATAATGTGGGAGATSTMAAAVAVEVVSGGAVRESGSPDRKTGGGGGGGGGSNVSSPARGGATTEGTYHPPVLPVVPTPTTPAVSAGDDID